MENNKNVVLIEDLGMHFEKESSNQKVRLGLFKCYCGKEFKARISSIKSKHTKSCGCLHKDKTIERSKKHGLAKHRLYDIWNSMIQRCNKPKHKAYKNYGGRGIKVCSRWLEVDNFIEDMYPSYQEGLSLDRIDVDGDYEPDNCRWTTKTTQSRNTRDIQIDNTSGYRGVSWHKGNKKWICSLTLDSKQIHLGYHQTALEAGKAYERYVRINNLEHNFTPALTEDEIKEIENLKSVRNN